MKNNEKIEKLIESSNAGKRKKKGIIAVIAIAACFLAAVMLFTDNFSGVVSWLKPTHISDQDVTVTNFTSTVGIAFSDGAYTDLNETFVSKSNLSNMKLKIIYNGESDAYIRVKLFESFCNSDGGLLPASTVNYVCESDWKYHTDGYYYYKKVVKGVQPDETDSEGKKATNKSINFIKTGSTLSNASNYGDSEGFKLVAIVEQVQPDRFEEFFGFEPNSLGIS